MVVKKWFILMKILRLPYQSKFLSKNLHAEGVQGTPQVAAEAVNAGTNAWLAGMTAPHIPCNGRKAARQLLHFLFFQSSVLSYDFREVAEPSLRLFAFGSASKRFRQHSSGIG